MIDAQVAQVLTTDDLKFIFSVILLVLLSRQVGGLVTVEAAGKAA